jgi:endonuclease/exonuclease/phosphatase family metal-dependent hydrolase
MSFNVWVGGTNVNQGPTKVRDAIVQAGADIVAMQESNGLAAQLAAQLGWYSVQPASSAAVLSRYPITATLGVALHNAGVGVRVRLSANPPQDVIVWSAHLTAYPYGPYQACLDGFSVSRILRDQRRTQLPEAEDLLRLMAPFIADADNIPVFLIGDFNTPSHLDWTPATTPTTNRPPPAQTDPLRARSRSPRDRNRPGLCPRATKCHCRRGNALEIVIMIIAQWLSSAVGRRLTCQLRSVASIGCLRSSSAERG